MAPLRPGQINADAVIAAVEARQATGLTPEQVAEIRTAYGIEPGMPIEPELLQRAVEERWRGFRRMRENMERLTGAPRWEPNEAPLGEPTRLPTPEEYNQLLRNPVYIDPMRPGAFIPVNAATLPVPPPARPAVRIRVSVSRGVRVDANGVERSTGPWAFELYVGDEAIDVPDRNQVVNFLPKAIRLPRARRYGNTYRYWCEQLDTGRLTPQQLHDGFRGYLIAYFTDHARVESEETLTDETRYLLTSQPATLEVGGRVFRLTPAGQTDVRPLIKRVREKALQAAIGEADGIRTRARTEAANIVSQAEERAGYLRQELEEERRTLSQGRIPEFLQGCSFPIKQGGGSAWSVLLALQVEVREIRFTIREWQRILHWNPLVPPGDTFYTRFHCWLHLASDGSCDYTKVNAYTFKTTHIAGHTCMDLNRVPRKIRNATDIEQLRQGLERGLWQINLNSPLARNVWEYHPVYKAFIPKYVQDLLLGNKVIEPRAVGAGWETPEEWAARVFPNQPAGYTPWDWSETVDQEAAATFTAPPPERIRV